MGVGGLIMIIHAKSIYELGNMAHSPKLFFKIKSLLDELLDEKGTLFKYPIGSELTMVGYKFVPYKTSGYDGHYPLVSIVPQKNNISVYIMHNIDENQTLVEKYKTRFGSTNCGKSCIRFKRVDEKMESALREIISEFETLI